MGYSALELACVGGLWVARVSEPGVVRREGARLLIGPGADDALVADVAARRILERRGQLVTDEGVALVLTEHGYSSAGRSMATQ